MVPGQAARQQHGSCQRWIRILVGWRGVAWCRARWHPGTPLGACCSAAPFSGICRAHTTHYTDAGVHSSTVTWWVACEGAYRWVGMCRDPQTATHPQQSARPVGSGAEAEAAGRPRPGLHRQAANAQVQGRQRQGLAWVCPSAKGRMAVRWRAVSLSSTWWEFRSGASSQRRGWGESCRAATM